MQFTVLIIDDNEDELFLMERILSRISPEIAIVSALSGEEGLAKLNGDGALPRLILLDLKMIGLSGIDTLRRIRSEERLKSLPIIIVTNSTLESERAEAIDAGAYAFLRKDLDIDRFGKDIKVLLERFSKD